MIRQAIRQVQAVRQTKESTMDTVKINTKKLLGHLKKNREAHLLEITEAMIGYREAVIKAVKAQLKAANAHEDIDHRIDVVRPMNFTKEYDEAIALLEWSTDAEVELSRAQFVQYVQDQWTWKMAFAASTQSYKG